MKRTMLKSMLFLFLGGSLLGAGCVYRERVEYREPAPDAAVPEGELDVTEAPPAPLVDEVTVAPGPGFVWVGGYWAWRGHWEWEHGYWIRPPYPGAVWVRPHYAYRHGRHFFIRGHWR